MKSTMPEEYKATHLQLVVGSLETVRQIEHKINPTGLRQRVLNQLLDKVLDSLQIYDVWDWKHDDLHRAYTALDQLEGFLLDSFGANHRSEIIGRMLREWDRGVEKHGDWSDYTPELMLDKIKDELKEVQQAFDNNDLTQSGHCMSIELIQVAAICLKGAFQIEKQNTVKQSVASNE